MKKTTALQRIRAHLKNAAYPDFVSMLTAPTTIIGVGSSGAEIVLLMFRELKTWLGALPRNVRFILIDADKDPRFQEIDEKTHVAFIPTSDTGAGTNTARGRKLAEAAYERMLQVLTEAFSGLMGEIDPRFPTNLSGSESQKMFLVGGGSGGTGGGTTDLAIICIHHASRSAGIKKIEINLASIGSVMPTSDINRSIEPDRVKRILANGADNYQAWYSQMNTLCKRIEHPPGHDPFTIYSSTRIYSKFEFENENNSTRIHRNHELHQMIAASLQLRIFSPAGKERASRERDEFINGASGQVNPATAERIKK